MSVHSLMPGPIGPDTLGLYLTAFADGELDAADNLAVLRYVAGHPEAIAELDAHQRLRTAAMRVVASHSVAVPAALRDRIAAIEPDFSIDVAPRPMTGGPYRLMRLTAFAAAAVVLLAFGLMAGRAMTNRPVAQSAPSGPIGRPDVIPVTVVSAVTKIHVDCSRFLAYHTGDYPASLQPLGEIVKTDLASDKPEPDLTSAGYTFVGAGPCGHPLDQTVHLLYRSSDKKKGSARDTLSVFVQPFTGQYDIEPGRAYLLTPADAPHPLLVWRTLKAVYFITGDDMREVNSAAQMIPAKA